MRAFRDEQSGLEYYSELGGPYIRLENDINEERARTLVDQTAPFRSDRDRSFGGVTILLTEGEVTLQARSLLAAEGIKIYWPADWQRTPPETSGDG